MLDRELALAANEGERATLRKEIAALASSPAYSADPAQPAAAPSPPTALPRSEFTPPPPRAGETNNQYQKRVHDLEIQFNANKAAADRARTTAAARPPSAAQQKAIDESDKAIMGGREVQGYIKRAKELNDTAMGFYGAGTVATAGSYLPEGKRPKIVDNTAELDNVINSSVLPNLKAIFGGAPSEGERKLLLDVAGSVNKNPAVRKTIFERAEKAAQERIVFNQRKAKLLREGKYYGPEGSPNAASTPPPPPGFEVQP
jgi:hypothetical protein